MGSPCHRLGLQTASKYEAPWWLCVWGKTEEGREKWTLTGASTGSPKEEIKSLGVTYTYLVILPRVCSAFLKEKQLRMARTPPRHRTKKQTHGSLQRPSNQVLSTSPEQRSTVHSNKNPKLEGLGGEETCALYMRGSGWSLTNSPVPSTQG